MKKTIQLFIICIAVIIAATIVIGNISQIFNSINKRMNLSPSEEKFTRNQDNYIIRD